MDIINFFKDHFHLFLILAAMVALMIGSFLNVVIYRLPRMMINEWNQECREYLGLKTPCKDTEQINLWAPLSHCPQCKKRLKPWHNIPVLSYFVPSGHCAYCRATISLRYPIVELLCCVTSVYAVWHFGLTPQMLGALLFTWILICLTFIDLEYHLLPDQLTYLLVWSGLLLSLLGLFTDMTSAILGGALGYLVFAVIQWTFEWVTGKVGMGQGDFKFLAGLGAFLGWQQLPIIILLASLMGIIFSLIHMSIKRKFQSVPMPFGPYLSIAGWVSLFWGPELLHHYLRHFSL